MRISDWSSDVCSSDLYRTDAGPRTEFDRSSIRGQLAGNQLQQSRFARAVATHETDLVAVGNGDGGILDDGASSDAICEIVDTEHGGARDSTAPAILHPRGTVLGASTSVR